MVDFVYMSFLTCNLLNFHNYCWHIRHCWKLLLIYIWYFSEHSNICYANSFCRDLHTNFLVWNYGNAFIYITPHVDERSLSYSLRLGWPQGPEFASIKIPWPWPETWNASRRYPLRTRVPSPGICDGMVRLSSRWTGVSSQRAINAEICGFICCCNRLLNKQLRCLRFEVAWHSCDATV